VEPPKPVDPAVRQTPSTPFGRDGGGRPEPPAFGVELPAESARPAAAALPADATLSADATLPADATLSADAAPPIEARPADEVPSASGAGDETESADREKGPSVWNARSVSLIFLAIVMILCVAGGGVGYVMYRRATEPDRSNPSVVVREYLHQTFDSRDAARAQAVTCGDTTDVSGITSLLDQITSKEQQFDIHIAVRWDGFQEQQHGSTGSVALTLRIEVPEATGAVSESLQQWQFTTRKQSGWQVCTARRVS
jgi:hypothetical protein